MAVARRAQLTAALREEERRRGPDAIAVIDVVGMIDAVDSELPAGHRAPRGGLGVGRRARRANLLASNGRCPAYELRPHETPERNSQSPGCGP
jgi:hypothetical protein